MHRHFLLVSFILVVFLNLLNAQQNPLQTIKGTVVERSLSKPLVGATIELLNATKTTSITDAKGYFKIEGIPVGRHSLRISYVGFKTVTLNNLLVESGKELDVNVEMDEEVQTTQEVIVQSKPNKAKPLNQFSLVSSRMFSVEETRRFAASINDPSRIATGFAGVVGNGNTNALIIRGNAPNGLLWRMEGVDIPNPNHFASVGTSGGGVSILSAQLLANSDFMTGAFAAEYGNVLSGVFDIKLRKGNANKREHTFSASVIGIDFATEGYFKKGSGASYLINYRYGFLSLMQKVGINIGEAPTTFQDLSFNINLPTKHIGTFTIFGFGGLSQQKTVPETDSILWTNSTSARSGRLDLSNTGAVGLTHSIFLSPKTILKTIVSVNASNIKAENSRLDKFNGPLIFTRINQFQENNTVVSMVATHKFNKYLLLKLGMYKSFKGFNLQQREAVNNILSNKVKSTGNTELNNYFLQFKVDPINRLSIQFGMHGQYFALNKKSVLEPRFGIKYMTGKTQFLSFGFGKHAQIQPLGNYFARIKVGVDTLQPNMGLDFSRANHYVLGYSIQLAPNWNLKAEGYYQWLYNVPVSALTLSSYSLINQEDDYAIVPLANKGDGKNYGVEFTLDRWWNDQFYLLSTLSLYNSSYMPSDRVWRNTRYNSNSTFTFLMGKEWNIKRKRPSTIAIDLKMIESGGVRVTPINVAQSIAQKTTILDNTRIYGEKLANFFRIDFQMEWKFQYNKRTGSAIVGVQNLLNRKNPYSQSFDVALGRIKYNYLLGLIPVIGYKIDF